MNSCQPPILSFWDYVNQNPFWTLIYLFVILVTVEAVATLIFTRSSPNKKE